LSPGSGFNATRVRGWRHIPADLAAKSSELRSLDKSLGDEVGAEQHQDDSRDLLRASAPSFPAPPGRRSGDLVVRARKAWRAMAVMATCARPMVNPMASSSRLMLMLIPSASASQRLLVSRLVFSF
jgi:hypothetical protein